MNWLQDIGRYDVRDKNLGRPLAAVLLVVLALVFLVVWHQGETSTESRVIRYLVLPFVMLWLGMALSGNRFFVTWLDRWHINNRGVQHILLAVLLYCVLLFSLKFSKLISLNYELFDAGIYINKLWRISAAGWGEALHIALVEGHFQPILLLYGMFYGWFESPWLPYLLETVTLASGAIPVFLLARKILSAGIAPSLIAFSYLLHPIVQFNDILGFHPDHIVLPALLWAFYFAEAGRYRALFLSLVVLSLGSEPWIPLASAFGLFLALHYKKTVLGLVTAMGFMGLFVFVLFYLLPHYGALNSSNSVFSAESAYGALLSGNSVEFFKLLVEPRKIFFLFFLLFPFLLLPLRAWAVMVVALPDLAKTLLSSELLHYSVEGHYTLGLIGVLFVGYIHALKELSGQYGEWVVTRLPVVTLVITAGLSIAHSPLPTSFDFWSNWSGGAFNYGNYLSSERTYSLQTVEELVGADPETKIEITNAAFTPELGKRSHKIQLFPSPHWKQADFVVLDRTHYKGAGAHTAQSEYGERFAQAISELGCCFTLLYEDDQVQLWSQMATLVVGNR